MVSRKYQHERPPNYKLEYDARTDKIDNGCDREENEWNEAGLLPIEKIKLQFTLVQKLF